MRTNLVVVSIIVFLLQGLNLRIVELQTMPMPMMWDMWLWLFLLVAVLVVAIALVAYLSTRPHRRAPSTPSPTLPPQSQTPIIENTQATTLTEVEKPFTKAIQLRKALEIVRPTLHDDERRVVNEIVKAGGEILQSELPERTDFSKATVSKLIKSLETMGVVTREKHKWTYWVRISDKLISGTKNA